MMINKVKGIISLEDLVVIFIIVCGIHIAVYGFIGVIKNNKHLVTNKSEQKLKIDNNSNLRKTVEELCDKHKQELIDVIVNGEMKK